MTTDSDDDKLSILDIADVELAKQRLGRGKAAVSKCVIEVFEAENPDERFRELAKAYIWNAGEDVRAGCITDLAWAFGAERPALKKLLRSMSIVGQQD